MPESKYVIRKAVRQPTTVLVALAGPSGSGKTVSGLRLSIGLARGWRNGRAVMIDTEHRRGTHHAHKYDFDYLELKPPFSTEAYLEAVLHCDAQNYGAIFVDSWSHNWNGEGGLQDVHDEAIAKLAGGDAGKIEALDGLAWKKAKLPYKKMIGRFTRLDSHIVFGLRAEDKIKYVREGGKTKVEHVGFQPICEKGFMFEVLTSFMLYPDARGLPSKPIKLDGDHAQFFPPNVQITEESGAKLAEWARANDAPKSDDRRTTLLADIKKELATLANNAQRQAVSKDVFKVATWADIEALPLAVLEAAVTPAEGANISRLEASVITTKESA
jgi:hypothetical protein